MRDIPDIYRYLVIALLILLLFLIMKGWGGGVIGVAPGQIESSGDKAEKKIDLKMNLYPPVPPEMPDFNDGYLFNQERQFLEDESSGLVAGAGALGPVDLNEIIYSGSLILGDVRKALITYQEAASVKPRVANRRTGRKPRENSVQKTYRHKQLDLGEDFMGYKVANIEIDRIVFERGSEKIEKFLYDGSKNRVVVKNAARTGAPNTSAADKTGRGQSPPQTRSTTVRPPATTKAESNVTKSVPASRRSRRSQRFLGLDPSVLTTPPGDRKPAKP